MLNRINCTGCGACSLKCPTHAISMECDSEGFLYPEIDIGKCVNCGKCKEVCHSNLQYKNDFTTKVYAAVNKKQDILRHSSSGGVFSAIADFILESDGICYGVAVEKLKIQYLRVDNKQDLYKIMGSKYVQAENSKVFESVEKDCKTGKKVLFVGTPCLVAGLKSFLKEEYKNLYTLDIVCHGTPSKIYFHKYIEYLKNKLKIEVMEFNFRDKSKYGISCISSCKIKKNGKSKKIVLTNQLLNYYYFYMFADSYRESCYKCKYTNLNRVSDITLGDFWGIEKLNSKLDVEHGCSAIIINSSKGEFLLTNVLSNKCYLEKKSIDDLTLNSALYRQVDRPFTRDTLYNELLENDFEYLVNGRYKPSFVKYAKGIAKGLLPSFLQNIIRKYL